MIYGVKICQRCKEKYQPTGGKQKYCEQCRHIEKKEKREAGRKRRLADHPEQIKAKQSISMAKWRATHKADILAYKKAYHTAHPQENVARQAAHWKTHRLELQAQNAAWAAEHPDKMRAYFRKHLAKRKTLGFLPINRPFSGCEGHHIDEEHVIYIPKELHRSIYHNIFTGKNMTQINIAIDEWIKKEEQYGKT